MQASSPSAAPARAAALSLWPLYAAQALSTGAVTVSTILASLIVSDLASERLSGLPATLIQAAAALSAVAFAGLMLRRGRRLGLALAFGVGAVGAALGFLGAQRGSLGLFLLGAALMGAAQGGYQQARYAVSEAVAPNRRGLALGVLMLMGVGGSFAMTALSPGVVALSGTLGASDEAAGWLVGGGLLAVAAALLLFVWRPVPVAAALPASGPRRAVGERLVTDLSGPGVPGAVLALAVAQGVMVTLMSLTPLRAHHLGMGHGDISALISLHVAGMFAFGLLTGPLLDRVGLRPGYVVGAALLLLAALTSPGSTHASLGFSMFVLGLGWNLLFLSATKALSPHPAAQGLGDSLGYFAAGGGVLLGGLVLGTLGFGTLAWACAALSLLPLLSAWGVRRSG